MSEGFRRISVAEVRAAVEKTGLELVTKVTCDRDGTGKPCGGCAMFVQATAEGFTPIDTGYVFIREMAEHLGLDHDYADGLACGFDDRDRDPSSDSSTKYLIGLSDGLLLRTLLPAAVTA